MIKAILLLILFVSAALFVYVVSKMDMTARATASPLENNIEDYLVFEAPKGNNDIICGGLLYSNLPDGVSCKDGFLVQDLDSNRFNCVSKCNFDGFICLEPGICEYSFEGKTVNIQIDIPRFIKLGEWTEGKIILTGTEKVELDVYDAEINIDSIKEGENIVRIRGTKVSEELSNFGMDSGSIIFRLDDENSPSWEFYVYDENAKKCGEGFWNHKGLCIDDIFYPGADCVAGKGCIDYMHMGIPERDIEPKGEIKALIVTINLPQNLKREAEFYENLGERVSNWYKKESKLLTGKELVDIKFKFAGHKNQFFFDNLELLRYNLEKEFGKYDFFIVIQPNLDSTGYDGHVGGFYYYNGLITLDANSLDENILAHEIAHGFGAEDIYDRQYLCNYRWNNYLYCSDSWISGQMLGIIQDNSLENKHLGNLAVEFGWIEPKQKEVKDIEIADVEIIENVEYDLVVDNYQYFIYPDDVLVTGHVLSDGFPIVADVYMEIDGEQELCPSEGGKFYCISRINGRPDKIIAKFNNLSDEKLL